MKEAQYYQKTALSSNALPSKGERNCQIKLFAIPRSIAFVIISRLVRLHLGLPQSLQIKYERNNL